MSKFRSFQFCLLSVAFCLLAITLFPGAAGAGEDSLLVSRGESLNQAFVALTGEAVNPLFGVAAIGIFNYLKADIDARDLLPLHDQPIVWVPLLVIIFLMLLNSTLCEAMPWLKVPLNALGDLVNKGGAVAVLPLVVKMFADAAAEPMRDYIAWGGGLVFPSAYAAEFSSASSGGGFSLVWLLAALAGAVIYLAVWLTFNVVDVLIMICPFPGLDAILKSLRLAVAGALLGSHSISPGLAFALAASVILVSALCAGWSFRLSLFGLVYSTDILFFRKGDFNAYSAQGGEVSAEPAGGTFAFSSTTLKRQRGVPMRTPGQLKLTANGALQFIYRPWLVLGTRTIDLGPAKDFAAGRGLLNPFVVSSAATDEPWLRFSPRFRGGEEELRGVFGLSGIVDCGLSGNVRHWLEGIVRGKAAAA